MPEYLSQRQFAKHAGVSHVRINRLVKEGRLPSDDRGRVPLTEGLKAFEASKRPGYDANREHGRRQRKNSRKKSEQKKVSSDTTNVDIPSISVGTAAINEEFNKARLAEKIYQANLKKIEYQREKGELLEKDEVRADAMKIGAELREKLNAIPPRIAPLCEGLSAREIQDVIDTAINEALETLHKSRFGK